MTLRKGTITGLYPHMTGSYTDPKPQISQYITLAATVDGTTALSMSTDAPDACGWVALSWGGASLLTTASAHGQGIQFAWNCLPTGEVVSTNVYSPTEQGSQSDGASTLEGSSPNNLRLVWADGKRCIRRTKPAFWLRPNQVAVPSHPALNTRIVSEFETTVDTQIGYLGNDHIIAMLIDAVVPDIAEVTSKQILDMVSCSVYGRQSIFSVFEYLNPATGATRTNPGLPDTSQTEVSLISSADTNTAMAVYQPLGEWGSTGYAQLWLSGGTIANIFIRAREIVANIVPGVRRYNSFLCIGTRAQVISAVRDLHAANITRAVNIDIPVLAA